jgi:heptosyltransferase-2
MDEVLGVRPARGRILVIRGGAIGDFILTLPALAALRQQFPDAFLEVLGYPHIAQLAVAGGVVDRAQPIEARAMAGFFARGGELEERLAEYFSEFDIIVSYLYDPDHIFRTNVASVTKAQFIQGPHRPSESEKTPAARVYLKPLERLAIFEADPVPRLAIPQKPGKEEARDPSPMLALHPGSGSESKNWPEEKWAALLQELINATAYRLLLTGGEAEGERLQRLAAALPPARFRVAQSLPLVDLARLLQQCGGFVGHDSGVSHLAAAVGLPGVVLWGATREEIWRPPSPEVTLLRGAEGLAEISVGEVVTALRKVAGT